MTVTVCKVSNSVLLIGNLVRLRLVSWRLFLFSSSFQSRESTENVILRIACSVVCSQIWVLLCYPSAPTLPSFTAVLIFQFLTPYFIQHDPKLHQIAQPADLLAKIEIPSKSHIGYFFLSSIVEGVRLTIVCVSTFYLVTIKVIRYFYYNCPGLCSCSQ